MTNKFIFVIHLEKWLELSGSNGHNFSRLDTVCIIVQCLFFSPQYFHQMQHWKQLLIVTFLPHEVNLIGHLSQKMKENNWSKPHIWLKRLTSPGGGTKLSLFAQSWSHKIFTHVLSLHPFPEKTNTSNLCHDDQPTMAKIFVTVTMQTETIFMWSQNLTWHWTLSQMKRHHVQMLSSGLGWLLVPNAHAEHGALPVWQQTRKWENMTKRSTVSATKMFKDRHH